jgi:hypothetical protein
MPTGEVIPKITAIAEVTNPSEGDVQHLFALGRKLVERLPEPERPSFGLVKFYGDWTVHTKIDRSRVGAGVLQRVADIVFDQLKKTDTDRMVRELTDALSFEKVREEINRLVEHFGGPAKVFGHAQWRAVVLHLVEIISSTPLMIADEKRFRAFKAAIDARPLKAASVVESLQVIKVPTSTFDTTAPAGEITFCIMITTTDTTRIVVPLAK